MRSGVASAQQAEAVEAHELGAALVAYDGEWEQTAGAQDRGVESISDIGCIGLGAVRGRREGWV